ncbi:MAG: hypothetical protein KME15_07835 [Drouetiella hepatica Uher 2000/2452]|uniref:Uncharacterized protein n=1 Tax=Drouetiella hepatica Uher 2000/2452 TaxID=904376 RepID=A0A951QB10_9CYAN|nr:hypothetical protein [Drouetiella hepatica Uher 2000/2452]
MSGYERYERRIANAKAIRTGTLMVGREAPHHQCPKQAGDSHNTGRRNIVYLYPL